MRSLYQIFGMLLVATATGAAIAAQPLPHPVNPKVYRDKVNWNKGEEGWNKRTVDDMRPEKMVHTPDCRETPVSLKQITDAASDPATKNQDDFIAKLPANSLNTFTFVYDSKSPEAPCISKKYPGVIRMSTTGNVALRYTCDPACKLYNQAQLLHFDDKTRRWQAVELNFKLPGHERVNKDPKSCVGCHNPSGGSIVDLRPNWQEYPFWNGFYGGADDSLDSQAETNYGISKDVVSNVDYQQSEFMDFKERIKSGDLKDNKCYQNLPWYEGEDPRYRVYPYSYQEGKSEDYFLRPNLKFTEVLSHRMAQRLARKFEEHPDYSKIKYQLMIDALGCDAGGYDAEDGPSSPREVLSAAGQKLGFTPGDFTMHFGNDEATKYISAVASEIRGHGDVNIFDVAVSQLFLGLSKESPELKPFLQFSRGESLHFGEQFSCIDDLGGEMTLSDVGQLKACEILRAKQKALAAEAATHPTFPRACVDTDYRAQGFQFLASDTMKILKKLDPSLLSPAELKRGREVVRKVCASCHSETAKNPMKKELRFFGDEQTLLNHLCDSGLAARAKERMNDPVEPMPPYGSSFGDLSENDKASVSAYLSSLKAGCK